MWFDTKELQRDNRGSCRRGSGIATPRHFARFYGFQRRIKSVGTGACLLKLAKGATFVESAPREDHLRSHSGTSRDVMEEVGLEQRVSGSDGRHGQEIPAETGEHSTLVNQLNQIGSQKKMLMSGHDRFRAPPRAMSSGLDPLRR